MFVVGVHVLVVLLLLVLGQSEDIMRVMIIYDMTVVSYDAVHTSQIFVLKTVWICRHSIILLLSLSRRYWWLQRLKFSRGVFMSFLSAGEKVINLVTWIKVVWGLQSILMAFIRPGYLLRGLLLVCRSCRFLPWTPIIPSRKLFRWPIMVRLQIATFCYGGVISVLVLLCGAFDRNSGYLIVGETFLRDGVLKGSPG